MSIKQLIESDSRIEVRAEMDGDRLLIKIPTNLIEHHNDLKAIRGEDKKIDLLKASTHKNGPIYPPLLYAEVKGGKVVYYIADGHQRLAAARANQQESMYAQVVLRWHSVEEAFNECISIQYARYEMSQEDLFSVLLVGKLSDQELATMTSISVTTLAKMRKVCDQKPLRELIKKEAMSINVASSLIDATNKNSDKLEALLKTLAVKSKEYQKEADHYKNKYARDGIPKNKKLASLAKLATYFRNETWSNWVQAIEDFEGKRGDPLTFETEQSSKAAIIVADTSLAWKDVIAITFQGGNKHSDMSLQNLQGFRDSLEFIGKNLDVIIKRRRKDEIAEEEPFESANPTTEIEPPAEPTEQSLEMETEDD